MIKHGARIVVTLLALGAGLSAPAAAQSVVDPSLPPYRPGEKLSGTITLAGFNSMSQVAAIWAEGFKQYHPDVKFDIQILSTSGTLEAVGTGKATFGLLSRDLAQEETAALQKQLGYAPTVVVPTLEAIGVFVHKDNPIESLTMQQLDAAFSATNRRGAEQTAATWGDLGLTGAWAKRAIVTHGRDDEVGMQAFFKTAVLQGGEFRKDLKENEDSLELIKAIGADPAAIGFVGTTYMYPGVKAVPIATAEGEAAVDVGSVAATLGQYPLLRPLPMVVNQPPRKGLSELDSEFLKYVLSRFGQEDAIKAGYQPISARPARIALDAIGAGKVN
jgi:phosphate transport system substrate-binding protein